MPPRATAVHSHHLGLWIIAGIVAAAVGIGIWTYFAMRIAARLSAAAPSTINQRLLTSDHPSSAVHDSPAIIDRPYVASSIKGIYHRADCRYAASVEHRREYASQEAAAADGKVPCKVCLPVLEVAAK